MGLPYESENYDEGGGASAANLTVSSITSDTANLQSAVIIQPQVNSITLIGPSYSGDAVRTFARLKTNYHQILSTDTVSQNDPNGVNTNQPISCQSLLDAAANASFTTQGTGEHLLPPSGSSINTHLTTNYYDHIEIDNAISSLETALTGKIPTSRLGPQGVSPTIVDRTDTTSNTLVTEQSLLNWVGGNLTEGGNDYQIVQPKLYITDSANTREINSQDGQGNNIVEFIKARVNSSKDGGFDSTDDRRLTTNLAIHNHLTTNYVPKSDLVNNSTFSTNNIFTASDVKPPSELAVRVGLDSKPTAQLLSYNVGQPIILGSNNSAVISDTVLNHYAVPIPTSGSGAGKIVARNTNNDGWEFVSSTGSSSSLLIDTHTNATSTATKTGQTIGTGLFYQNGSQLRVQYKSSSSNFQDVLIGLFDTTSPVITILGNNPISITVNNTYTDAGATALDSIDGDVTSQIQIGGDVVDTTTLGSYYITYTVSDNAGNIASAIRTVNVVDLGLFYSYDFTDTGGSLSGTTFTFADGRTATLSGSGTSSTWNSADGIYVAPGNLLNLPPFQFGGNFSFEILFKWGDVSNKSLYQQICYFTSSGSNTFEFVRDQSLDSLLIAIAGFYTPFGNTPTPGTTFEHVVLTSNQTAVNTATYNVYMNGTQVGTGSGSPESNVTRTNHYFGGVGTSYHGNVRMKYMKFYNRALTEAEVQSLYSP